MRWEQRCDTAAYWALQIIGLLCLITMTAMFGVVIYRGITGLSCERRAVSAAHSSNAAQRPVSVVALNGNSDGAREALERAR